MYEQKGEPFYPRYAYIVQDVLFVVFSVLYMLGDSEHYDIVVLRCAKPLPTWIMIIQLFPTRNTHAYIKTIMAALFFGSIGDILLEISSLWDLLFELGALSFLVGHLLYVVSFISLGKEAAQGRSNLEQVMSLKGVYIVIWLVLESFAFWSVSFLVKYLESDSIMNVVMPIYGTFLVMLCMGGFFFFFTTFRLTSALLKAGLCFMLGSLIFFASDNILAHNKFNKNLTYLATFSKSLNAYLIMVTYYVAQFFMAKGAFWVCLHFSAYDNKLPTDQRIVQNTELRT